MDVDTVSLIARIRRAMPRNADVMALCDWCERQDAAPKDERKPLTRAEIQRNYRLRKRATVK